MENLMDGMSMDVEQSEREKLRAVFPQCFSEGRLDIDKLLNLCGEYITEDFEKYKFEWKGKSECLQLAGKRSTGTLRPCVEESVDWDSTGNLYIEGDNLEVLKLLQTAYFRKVKMIYIDPPYNTGNDFIYEDDFADNIARYKEVTSQTTKSNPETMGRFHTNWLNMMYPRLRLAANLLRDDGVIFISIDENEIHNLRKVCDEVFGEENYIGTIIWKNATDNNPTQIAIEHEYIVCFAKNRQETESVWKTKVSAVKEILIDISQELCAQYADDEMLQVAYTEWLRSNKSQLWPLDRYKYIDRGGIYTGSQSVHNPGREGYRYDVIHPITGMPCKQPLLGYRFPETTMADLVSKGKILYGQDHNKIIELKVYAHEYEEKLSSIFELDGRLGSYDLKSFFGENTVFTNPKPVQLLARLLSFITTEDHLVLDFFSGSATVAQAIMEVNNTDGQHRRYICVQLPENLDLTVETADQKAKANIKNAIKLLDSINKPHFLSEIGKERIRRAASKIHNARNEMHNSQCIIHNEGNERAFSGDNCELRIMNYELDLGFRVFKLDTSNCRIWDNSPIPEGDLFTLTSRLNDMIERVKPDRTDLDMVFEIMLKLGISLTESVTPIDIDGKTAYSVREDCLIMVCLQDGITIEMVEQMAEYVPARIVFGQNCFADVTAMSNAKLTLRDRGIDMKFI